MGLRKTKCSKENCTLFTITSVVTESSLYIEMETNYRFYFDTILKVCKS